MVGYRKVIFFFFFFCHPPSSGRIPSYYIILILLYSFRIYPSPLAFVLLYPLHCRRIAYPPHIMTNPKAPTHEHIMPSCHVELTSGLIQLPVIPSHTLLHAMLYPQDLSQLSAFTPPSIVTYIDITTVASPSRPTPLPLVSCHLETTFMIISHPAVRLTFLLLSFLFGVSSHCLTT